MVAIRSAGHECAEKPLPAAIRLNWHLTSVLFSVNHGCATTPLIFATSLLDKDVGYHGSALLYVSTCLSSLFVSVPIILTMGQRGGLFLAMMLYSVYVGCFALATVMPMGSLGQWLVFLPASCVGGMAASLLWTAQGGYLDRSVRATMEATQKDRQSITSKHATVFAVYYLVLEVVFKLASSIALRNEWRPWVIFSVCLIVGIASALGTFTLRDLSSADTGAAKPRFAGKVLAAVGLWSDPAIWCLAFTNLAFGCSAAFMNGYVNATFTEPQLGAEYVGYFATSTALVAALFSKLFGAASARLGRKGPFLLIGSLCFAAIPALVLSCGLDGWGVWLFVPYVLQGCGRAVYESTNRGVFADFFPGARSEGAFANQMVQATLAFAFCFFFSASMARSALAGVILALAVATFPGYLLAQGLRQRQQQAQQREGQKQRQQEEGQQEEPSEVGAEAAA